MGFLAGAGGGEKVKREHGGAKQPPFACGGDGVAAGGLGAEPVARWVLLDERLYPALLLEVCGFAGFVCDAVGVCVVPVLWLIGCAGGAGFGGGEQVAVQLGDAGEVKKLV